jgi:bisanhydrobacterioruberin hydratase
MRFFYHQYIKPNQFIIALITCLAFHISGAIGMSLGLQWFVDKTPLNLTLSTLLILWTANDWHKKFVIFAIASFSIGMIVEWIGVNTQLLFGYYYYTSVMGWLVLGVPLLIGCNWFIVTYCSGMVSNYFFNPKNKIGHALITATIATIFDFLIEPIAIKLKFWQWLPDNEVPLYNYFCWFIFSFIIGLIFCESNLKPNKFAVILLIIQALFFLTLRFTI